ncbi:MAG: YciI family protein [Gammaproteobacteria bacterium]|nr:YciI family protein [Gammaproteobacteria bacterium]
MFIVILSYKKSISEADKYLSEHRAFLDNGYKNNSFVVSGPKKPRTGGVIISQLTDRNKLDGILKMDPFNIHSIADYEIIEFYPTKHHVNFTSFIVEEE